MHKAVYQALPEKKLKRIFLLFLKEFCFNFLFTKIRKFQSERRGLSPYVHKLTVLAEKLKGEKETLVAELTATPQIKDCISEYTKETKATQRGLGDITFCVCLKVETRDLSILSKRNVIQIIPH